MLRRRKLIGKRWGGHGSGCERCGARWAAPAAAPPYALPRDINRRVNSEVNGRDALEHQVRSGRGRLATRNRTTTAHADVQPKRLSTTHGYRLTDVDDGRCGGRAVYGSKPKEGTEIDAGQSNLHNQNRGRLLCADRSAAVPRIHREQRIRSPRSERVGKSDGERMGG